VSAERLFRKLKEALDAAKIPYMVTGSFVSALHGVPRATHDIDVVIAPSGEQIDALLKQFAESDYFVEPEDAMQALRHRTQFNVIDQHSIWKIDFILRKERPFSRAEFERRVLVNILGVSVYAAAPEDILLAKLEWAKLGESERQIKDAAGIIEIQRDKLDMNYVDRWVELLDIQPQWEAARAMAG